MNKWFRKNYNILVSSIAFYPAIIAIAFLLLSWGMLELDFSEPGKNIKNYYSWIRLKDATTARSIVSTIATGIISLMVFSFSMVMILLNQAASQMSNRMLESMIGNRFQQMILGIYIGTIVYALFLLSTIRDIDSGVYVPALSIYLLVLLTVLDIFLFIYFLHYVTQSVKFETIIVRVQKKTLRSLKKVCLIEQSVSFHAIDEPQQVEMPATDYFQGFDEQTLVRFAKALDGMVEFLQPAGSFLLKGVPLFLFYGKKRLSPDDLKMIIDAIDFYKGQPIEKNHYFGFHQLAEVALKALSPGINDPETAVLAINSLADLFLVRMQHDLIFVFQDNEGIPRIKTCNWDFESLFLECFQPIWEYGKKDFYIQNALMDTIGQLRSNDSESKHAILFKAFLDTIKEQAAKNAFSQFRNK